MSSVTAVPLQPTRARVLVYLWAGIIAAIALAAAFVWLTPMDPVICALSDVRRGDPTIRVTDSGLLYKVIEPGQGDARPTDEDVAYATLQVRLLNGTQVGGGDQPSPVPVANNLPGLSEAMKMMPKHSHYRFWIKPSLAFGSRAAGPIPANSTLVVDVQMLDFQSQALIQQMQAMQQMQAQQGGARGGGGPGAPGGAPPSGGTPVPGGAPVPPSLPTGPAGQ